MQHSTAMSGGEAGTQLLRDLNRFVFGQASDAPQQRLQVLAVDEFHGEKEHAFALANVIHATDVGMRDLPCHAHFRIELIAPAGALSMFGGEKLECDSLAEFKIIGAIDFAHAPAPQQQHHAIAVCDHTAGSKSVGWRRFAGSSYGCCRRGMVSAQRSAIGNSDGGRRCVQSSSALPAHLGWFGVLELANGATNHEHALRANFESVRFCTDNCYV